MISGLGLPVDFHSHILPGVDHGSSSIEMSLGQLRLANEHGVDRIIATSHFYPNVHSVDGFLRRRNKAYERLNCSKEAFPEVKLGAEVLFCLGIENLPGLDRLFVKGTNVLLLELPFSDFQPDYCYSVESLVKSGVDVILAHAERYSKDIIDQMTEYGAKIQINASALQRFSKGRVEVERWLKEKLVVALGSDIHSLDKHAYSEFKRAARKLSDELKFIEEYSSDIWNRAIF